MTREEQIKQQAKLLCNTVSPEEYFIKGAEWADRTMLDKACEWLRQANPKEAFVVYKSIQNDALCLDMKFTDEFVERFRKAMEQ